MTLQWLYMGTDLEFEENRSSVFVLEESGVYAKFIAGLVEAINGQEGDFSLYDNNKKLNIAKSVDLVFSPALIDMNTKKIQTQLFNEMKEISNDVCYELKEKVNNMIVSYLDELSTKLPYPISFNLSLDETGLYKQYEVRMAFESNDLTEKVISYIQLQATLCNVKVIVFINGKAYFSEEQLKEIYTCAFYNKIYILMVESGKKDCLPGEKYYIIDEDRCFIEVE